MRRETKLKSSRTKKQYKEPMKKKFNKNIKKIDNSLSKLTKRNRGQTQIKRIRNEKWDITTNTNELQRIIRESFMIEALKKPGIKSTYLNILKAIYNKPTVYIKLNGQNMKSFPLKSGIRQGCAPSIHLFDIVLQFLFRAIRQKK
jgi:hypothetical protein